MISHKISHLAIVMATMSLVTVTVPDRLVAQTQTASPPASTLPFAGPIREYIDAVGPAFLAEQDRLNDFGNWVADLTGAVEQGFLYYAIYPSSIRCSCYGQAILTFAKSLLLKPVVGASPFHS